MNTIGTPLSPARVQELADTRNTRARAVGYKAANLELMRAVTADTGAAWSVPNTFALDHDTVMRILGPKGTRAADLWADFVAQLADRTSLTKDDEARLSAIGDVLDEALQDAATRLPSAVGEWLESEADKTLIVRSTGWEDSPETPNAGGNESVPKVAPATEDVLEAMRVVLRSYVSPHSVQQQLRTGHRLSAVPFWPVLLQVMVGKDEPGGVAFSPERSAYTPGVTQVQGACDNESVVNGMGTVDSYYVGAGNTHAVVKPKDDVHPALAKPSTKSAARFQPVINVVTAEQVADAATTLIPLYESRSQHSPNQAAADEAPTSVDMEFVACNPLTLVQARPPKLTNNPRPDPTFVVPPPDAPLCQGVPILAVHGGMAALATSPKHIIIANDDAAAHAMYLGMSDDDARAVRCVVLRTACNATSHWANAFNTDEIPVLHFGDGIDTLSTWLRDGHAVAFDCQSGVAARLRNEDNPSLDTLKQAGIVRSGMRRHPIPPQQSMGAVESTISVADVLQLLHERGVDAVNVHNDAAIAVAEANGWGKPAHALQASLLAVEAATDDAAEAQALAALLVRAKRLQKVLPAALSERFDALFAQLVQDVGDLLRDRAQGGASAAAGDTLAARRRTYHLTWLRADVVQRADSEVVNSDSLCALINDAVALRGLLANGPVGAVAERIVPEALAFYARINDLALSQEASALWRDFVAANGREDDVGRSRDLARLVKTVTSLRMAPVWLNSEFVRVYKEARTAFPEAPARAATVALSQLDALLQRRSFKSAAQWAFDVDAWSRKWADDADFASADAERVGKAWAQMIEEAQTHLLSAAAVTTFVKASPVAKSAMLTARARAVDVCDSNIKTMLARSCPDSPVQRATLLRTMIAPLLEMRNTWAILLGSLNGRTPLEKQLQGLVDVYNELPVPTDDATAIKLLEIGPWFDVAGAQLGAGTNFKRHKPGSLHEVFTTAHQDILMAGVILQKNARLGLSMAPAPTQRLGNALLKTKLWVLEGDLEGDHFVEKHPEELGFEYAGSSLRNTFHAPQRNHSAKFVIQTDVGRQGEVGKLQLQVELYGWEDPDAPRMNRAATYAELFARACGLTFAEGYEPRYERDVMRFHIDIPVDHVENAALVLPDYLLLMTGTLYTGSRALGAELPQSRFKFTTGGSYEEVEINFRTIYGDSAKPPAFDDLITRSMWKEPRPPV